MRTICSEKWYAEPSVASFDFAQMVPDLFCGRGSVYCVDKALPRASFCCFSDFPGSSTGSFNAQAVLYGRAPSKHTPTLVLAFPGFTTGIVPPWLWLLRDPSRCLWDCYYKFFPICPLELRLGWTAFESRKAGKWALPCGLFTALHS